MTPRAWAVAVAVLAGAASLAVWSGVLAGMASTPSTSCTIPHPPAVVPGVPVVNR